MALWSVAFIGLRPLASLADGAIADTLGVRAAGVCLALSVLVRSARDPAHRAAAEVLQRHHTGLTRQA